MNKFILLVSTIVILSAHFIIFNFYKIEDKKIIVSSKPTVSNISLKKVVLKKEEIKKVSPQEEIKKIEPKNKVPKKTIKKNSKKIVKKAKRKVTKKIEKEIKEVKQDNTKIVPQVLNKTKIAKSKEIVKPFVNKQKIKNSYLAKVRAKIEKNKVYPKNAKRLRQQGKVVVSFIISKDGYIKMINLKSACPYKRLNNAAINILKTIVKFEPIPIELQKNKWAIDIPIVYSIREI